MFFLSKLGIFLAVFWVCCGMFFLWVCVVKTSKKINRNLTPSDAYGLPHRSQTFIFETPISKGVNRESSTDNHTGTKKTDLSWGRIWLQIVQIDFQKKISTKTKTTWVDCLSTIWICKQTQNNRRLPSLNIIRNCFGSRSLIKEFRKYIIEFYDSLTCSMKQHSILHMNHVWNMKRKRFM